MEFSEFIEKVGDSINVELADSKQRILATVVGVQAVDWIALTPSGALVAIR